MTHHESLLGLFLQDPLGDDASSAVSILPPHSAMKCQQTVLWPNQTQLVPGFVTFPDASIKSYTLQAQQTPCRIIIEGQGTECPAQDDLYPTRPVWVSSIIRWMRPCVAGEWVRLTRRPVPSTLCWHDGCGQQEPLLDALVHPSDHRIRMPRSGFLSYAPVFQTWVTAFSVSTQEWSFQSKWRLELQEIRPRSLEAEE